MISLATKSHFLGRTMTINIAPLKAFRKFWQKGDAELSKVWQLFADEYINRPYLDVPLGIGPFDYDITHDDYTVYHRNHDVTHATRQRLYAQHYLDIIRQYGKPAFSHMAIEIKNNPEIKFCLEVAVFLCRSGRTNEQPGKEDPSNARRSAELFEAVAVRLGFHQGLVRFLAFAIATHAPNLDNHPDLISLLPGKNNNDKRILAELLLKCVDLSHHTDLVRCKVGGVVQPVRPEIEKDLHQLLDASSVDIPLAVSNLLTYAIQACQSTGTRVKFQEFHQQETHNDPVLKVKHTQDVCASLLELKQVELDIRQQIHDGKYGLFNKLLQTFEKTGDLDLTNWTISTEELQSIKDILGKRKIESVTLIGTKPVEYRKELADFLQKRSTVENFSINQAEKLDNDTVSEFNRQFRQQAHAHQKESMPFEPSRIGSAYTKGISALIQQLAKEIKGEIPRFGGKEQFTQVKNVQKLSNYKIEKRYQNHKRNRPANDFPSSLSSLLQTINPPDITLKPGELLLYHGTDSHAAPLIMQNGFDEARCKYVSGNGYGPLGKGVYFTSELAKAATFARCSQCGVTEQCFCIDEELLPAERVVLLCQVFVGNPEIIFSKSSNLRGRITPPDSFNSTIALSKEIEQVSNFRSTEICIPEGAQAIPLFEIRFRSSPNYLLLDKWNEAIRNSELSSEEEKKSLLQKHQLFMEMLNEKMNNKYSNPLEIKQIAGAIKVLNKQISENISAKIKLTQKQDDKKINKLMLQNAQLNMLTIQLTEFIAEIKTENNNFSVTYDNNAIETFFSPNISKSLSNLLLPKNYSLKREAMDIVKTVGSRESKDLVSAFIESLNILIERNESKTKLPFFSSSPAHRMLLTQAMYRLRADLKSLDSRNIGDAFSLTDSTLTKLRGEMDKYPEIKDATAFQILNVFHIKLNQSFKQDNKKQNEPGPV